MKSLASNRGYALSSDSTIFGAGFRDLATADRPHPSLRFGLASQDGRNLSIELQYVATGSAELVEVASLELNQEHHAFQYALLPAQAGGLKQAATDLPPPVQRELSNYQQHLRAYASQVVHVPSARPPIAGIYEARDPATWSPQEVPYHLLQDRQLLQAVDEWFRRSLDGPSIDVDRANFAFRLVASEHGTTVNLASSGRGTQSALSVATILNGLALHRDQADLVIVEEPEAHLHPSAHGALADLILTCSRSCPVVVETHSENFVLRLRRRIAERSVAPADVALYYVEADHSLSTIEIDATGGTSRWPKGVFEADVEEAQAILRAKLAILGSSVQESL